MTKCNRCGEEIVWHEDGDRHVPYSLQIHYKSPSHIEAVRGTAPKKTKPAGKPKVETGTREMVVTNWGRRQAEELLPYAVGATLEDQFLAVLHYINNKEA